MFLKELPPSIATDSTKQEDYNVPLLTPSDYQAPEANQQQSNNVKIYITKMLKFIISI